MIRKSANPAQASGARQETFNNRKRPANTTTAAGKQELSARSIAFALSGKRMQRLPDKSFLCSCPLPSHGKGRGDRNPSLRVGDGQMRLLLHCYSGCDPRDVLDELRRRGLLNDGPPSPSHRPAKMTATPNDYGREQHRKAAWLWSQRKPIEKTIAERYLREARGITCALPPTLGYLPPSKPERHPAMVAAFGIADEIEPGVLAAPRNVEAVHLTLLAPDGSAKANS